MDHTNNLPKYISRSIVQTSLAHIYYVHLKIDGQHVPINNISVVLSDSIHEECVGTRSMVDAYNFNLTLQWELILDLVYYFMALKC